MCSFISPEPVAAGAVFPFDLDVPLAGLEETQLRFPLPEEPLVSCRYLLGRVERLRDRVVGVAGRDVAFREVWDRLAMLTFSLILAENNRGLPRSLESSLSRMVADWDEWATRRGCTHLFRRRMEVGL